MELGHFRRIFCLAIVLIAIIKESRSSNAEDNENNNQIETNVNNGIQENDIQIHDVPQALDIQDNHGNGNTFGTSNAQDNHDVQHIEQPQAQGVQEHDGNGQPTGINQNIIPTAIPTEIAQNMQLVENSQNMQPIESVQFMQPIDISQNIQHVEIVQKMEPAQSILDEQQENPHSVESHFEKPIETVSDHNSQASEKISEIADQHTEHVKETIENNNNGFTNIEGMSNDDKLTLGDEISDAAKPEEIIEQTKSSYNVDVSVDTSPELVSTESTIHKHAKSESSENDESASSDKEDTTDKVDIISFSNKEKEDDNKPHPTFSYQHTFFDIDDLEEQDDSIPNLKNKIFHGMKIGNPENVRGRKIGVGNIQLPSHHEIFRSNPNGIFFGSNVQLLFDNEDNFLGLHKSRDSSEEENSPSQISSDDYVENNENSNEDSSESEDDATPCNNMDVVLVADSSDDVSDVEFRAVKQSMIQIATLLQQTYKSRVGVVWYGSRISDDIPLSDDIKTITSSIKESERVGGPNKPYLGILAGRGELLTLASDTSTKVLVFVTSGLQQYTLPVSQQARLAQDDGIKILVIGYGDGAVVSDLEKVAPGNVFKYDTASDILSHIDGIPENICGAAQRDENKNEEDSDDGSQSSDVNSDSKHSDSSDEESEGGDQQSPDSYENVLHRSNVKFSYGDSSSSRGSDDSSDDSNEDENEDDSNDKTEKTVPSPGENDNKFLRENTAEAICKNSKMVNGVGYKRYGTDCERFIQCFYDQFGNTRASIKTCPFGEYWDHHEVACVDSGQSNCPFDKCKTQTFLTRAIPNNCRAHWTCLQGQSSVMCCPPMMSYREGKGCVSDPDCLDACPPNDAPKQGSCDKRPMYGKPYLYKQWIESGHWVEMLCAPGTLFDENDCGCTMRTTYVTSLGVRAVSGETCRPELYLPFCQGVKDWSGRNTLVQNENDKVVVVDGKAYFDGSARLFIPRFAGATYGDTIYIKIRYKPDFSVDERMVNTNVNMDYIYDEPILLHRTRRDSQIENDGQNGDGATTNHEISIVQESPNVESQNEEALVGLDTNVQENQLSVDPIGDGSSPLEKNNNEALVALTEANVEAGQLQNDEPHGVFEGGQMQNGEPDGVFEGGQIQNGELDGVGNDNSFVESTIETTGENVQSTIEGVQSSIAERTFLKSVVRIKSGFTNDIDLGADVSDDNQGLIGDAENVVQVNGDNNQDQDRENIYEESEARNDVESDESSDEDYFLSRFDSPNYSKGNVGNGVSENGAQGESSFFGNWFNTRPNRNPVTLEGDENELDKNGANYFKNWFRKDQESEDNVQEKDSYQYKKSPSLHGDYSSSDEYLELDQFKYYDDSDEVFVSKDSNEDGSNNGKENEIINPRLLHHNHMNIIENVPLTSNRQLTVGSWTGEQSQPINDRIMQEENAYIERTKQDFLNQMEKDKSEILNSIEQTTNSLLENTNQIQLQTNAKQTTESEMALLSNGACAGVSMTNCLEDPSLSIGSTSSKTRFSVYSAESHKTDINVLKVKETDDEWRTAIFTIEDGVFRVFDQNSTEFEPVSGPVKTTFSGIYIGQGTGMNNFKGYIDEVYVYLCRPDNINDFQSVFPPKNNVKTDDGRCDYINKNVVKHFDVEDESSEEQNDSPWWG